MSEEVTSQTEEFLESIYRLQERDGVARTSELVKMLNIVPGTVTNTVERLERRGLIKHEAYRGVKLTEEGRTIALSVIRRHRLSERLLSDVLRMRWDRVHEAACQLEHGVTEEVADSIEKILNQPMTCPHGNPIPTLEGGITEEPTVPLSSLSSNAEGTVSYITDESQATLERIEKLGLKPGVHVMVIERNLRNGSVTFQTGAERRTASSKVASAIQIKIKNSGVDLRVHREVEKWNHKAAD
jgi:DtxR family Mn-dependent transcriptional regulator